MSATLYYNSGEREAQKLAPHQVVAHQFEMEASQTRDGCVAKNPLFGVQA